MPRLGLGPVIGLPYISASPAIGSSKPAMMRSKRRLAAARGADQADELALADREVGVAQRLDRLVAEREALGDALDAATIGVVASGMMLRAPAQQAVADRHDDAGR